MQGEILRKFLISSQHTLVHIHTVRLAYFF